MKNMKKLFCLITLLTLFSISVFADIAPRKPQPTPTPTPAKKNAAMSIFLSDQVSAPTLVIKKDFLRELSGTSENTSVPAAVASTQNIVGGAFLSLAVIFGGVWLMRGKKEMSKTTAAAIAVSIFGLAGTIAYANIAPPKRYPRINQDIFSKKVLKEGTAESRINVRISDSEYNNDFVLLIPKNASNSNKSEEE